MSDRDPSLAPLSHESEASKKAPDHEHRLGVSMLTKLALAAVVLSSLIISISCLMKANQLSNRAEELEAEVSEYNEKIKQLKYFINKEVDEEYIIEYAREYLNMHFPDEEIYYNDVNEGE